MRSKLRIYCLLVAFIVCLTLLFLRTPLHTPPLIQADFLGTDAPVFYSAFTANNTAALSLVGSAQVAPSDPVLRLADSLSNDQSGAAWYQTRQKVGDGFLTVFDFHLTDLVGGGADGLAFVIQDDPGGVTAQGASACGMGYAGITRSLAIEIDTYGNFPDCSIRPVADLTESNQDPDENHISVQTRGTAPNSASHQYSRGAFTPASNLSDGNIYTVMIYYEPGILRVYLGEDELTPQAIPVITATVDLAAELDLTDGMAWVGFTASTGGSRQNHDIRNWYFLDDWGLSCVTYRYDRYPEGSYNFSPAKPEGGSWPQEGTGWGTANGALTIDRGILYRVHEPVPDIADGFDLRLLNLMNPPAGSSEPPHPIRQIHLYYEWVNRPANVNLQGAYDLLVAENNTRITGNWPIVDGSQTSEGWFVTAVDLDNDAAVRPRGLRLSLLADDTAAVLRLKRASLCLETGPPPRPPVLPPGAGQACADLLANIQTRQQPFGQSGGVLIPSQPEFQFPADVTLEPYPDFTLGASGYPTSLTYQTHLHLEQDLLVPCVFMRNGEYYDPDPTAPMPFSQPIVRFTTVSDNAFTHESLTLLNYSGYFSVGSRDDWCYARDNVYGSIYNRLDLINYLPGYNVPPPRNHCLNPVGGGQDAGPCVTFVGSLFRAMGYFNVPAFAAVYSSSEVSSTIGNLYYNVNAYVDALPDQVIKNVVEPLVQVDYSNRTAYVASPVVYNAIRIYPLDEEDNAKIYGWVGVDPVRCEGPEGDASDPCALAQRQVDGHWGKSLSEPELHHGNTQTDPHIIWQSIKPGDIAITVIETADPPQPDGMRGEVYNTHIQIVVGWGPKQYSEGVRNGSGFYATYHDVPAGSQDDYVPYVMDRGDLTGTITVPGPRPFSYRMWHTATEFWVADTPLPAASGAPKVSAPLWLAASADDLVESGAEPVQPLAEPPAPMPASTVGVVKWQPTGSALALGNRSGLYLYTADLRTITAVAQGAVADIAWSPDGSRLVSGHAAQRAKVWNMAQNNALVGELTGHTAQLTSVSWSPDGARIGTTAKDGRFYLWDAATLAQSASLAYAGDSYLTAHAWSPDGARLAALDFSALYLWNAQTGQLLNSIPIGGLTGDTLAWLPDNRHILIAGAHIWDTVTGQPVGGSFSCSSGADTLAALSPDGNRIALTGIAAFGSEICLDSVDAEFFSQERVLLQTYEHFAGIGGMDWHPNGQQIAVASQGGWLSTWSVADGALVAVGPRPEATIDEIEYWLRRCTTRGATEYTLFNQFLAGDYGGFSTAVQTGEHIAPYCAPFLTATAAFYSENEPPGPPPTTSPQPLRLQSACPAVANGQYRWRIDNPNPYDVVLHWGWLEQSPALNLAAVVAPAHGSWILETPVEEGLQTLRILSGSFEATTVFTPASCDNWLPLIVRSGP